MAFNRQTAKSFVGLIAVAVLSIWSIQLWAAGPLQSKIAPQIAPSSRAAHAHPTYAHDVAPVIYRHCASCHHSRQTGALALCGNNAFSLLGYDDVKQRASEIARATRSREMPPWLPEHGYGDFAGAYRLSDVEIRILSEWARDGAPEGPVSAIPPAPKFVDGWQLGKPDLALEAARPLSIPAYGPDVFWNFIFSPNLKTTRYVRAIEVRPGSDLSLIHHANVVLDPARSARRQEKEPGAGFPGMDVALEHSPFDIPSHFLFWKPGSTPWVEPEGFAWRLDPGTDLVLNAHFMPAGTPEQALPSIGLYFTDKPPSHFPMVIELENDDALDIPAGDANFAVGDDFRLPRDVDVLAIYPHAHYLGHAIEAYATLPNGQREWLIRIPNWDPNWQAVYHYRRPVFLPKGTVISMRYHYDNSSANPRNPNSPPRRVKGGNQSTDEMAHLWLQVLPRGGEGDARVEIETALLEHRVEKYGDDFDARVSLGALMLARFDPAGAVAVLQQAVGLEPKQEEARRFLGMALEGVGRSPEAMQEFRAAVELNPGDAQARYELARGLVKAAKFDEALENFSQVASADPKNAQLRDDFGELLLRGGQAAEALKQFDAALALDPSEKAARRDRDLALDRLGDRTQTR
jgi:Flp pilus assembly protein TadD/mono/diheme cytochrome c family protein